MHNNKGFTLIELIAVLLIMGILTAVAVPKYIDLQSSAERKLILMVLADFNSQEHMSYLNHQITGDDGEYIPPIPVPSTLSTGISLKPSDGDSVLLFTGGGEYDVYRCPTTKAALWGQEVCPSDDVAACKDGFHWDDEKGKCRNDNGK